MMYMYGTPANNYMYGPSPGIRIVPQQQSFGGLMYPFKSTKSSSDRESDYRSQPTTMPSMPYQYNAPTAQQMFPGIGNPFMGAMPTQAQGNPMLVGGLFGAGRFLGGNYANQSGLLNSTSTTGT